MGHTHRFQLALKKKKNQVKSPSPESRVPELGSDQPIGSDRDSGRDIACRQEDPSNPHRFRAYHPPTFTGGKDWMVDDHWFMQIEKVLEAMEVTSDVTRIRLAVFYLENEAQIGWKGARTSRDHRGAFVREFSPRD